MISMIHSTQGTLGPPVDSAGGRCPSDHLPRHDIRSIDDPSINLAMDITKFVHDFRESAFLLGDYSTYRAQVSRRLRIVQKKLGRATPKNAKYASKDQVTAGDVAKNIEYAGYSSCNVPR